MAAGVQLEARNLALQDEQDGPGGNLMHSRHCLPDSPLRTSKVRTERDELAGWHDACPSTTVVSAIASRTSASSGRGGVLKANLLVG